MVRYIHFCSCWCSTNSCIFLPVDAEDPVMSGCLNTLTLNTEAGMDSRLVNWFEPMATDNSGQVNVTGTHTPGTLYPIGDTIVIYTAVDSSGNSDMCTFTITVIGEF